jgi:hypothetical protein
VDIVQEGWKYCSHKLPWADGSEGGNNVLRTNVHETTLLKLAEETGSKQITAACNYSLVNDPHRAGIVGAVELT